MKNRDVTNKKITSNDEFHEIFLIPTTAEDICISDFNMALPHNVMPIGMIGTNLEADGVIFQPDRFFRHDLVHANNWFSYDVYQNLS